MDELQIMKLENTNVSVWNFAQLKAELQDYLSPYAALVYTDDTIKDAKTDRTGLNRMKTAIENARKAYKAQCMEPYNAVEPQIKELVGLIEDHRLRIDTMVKDYEERKREEKEQEVVKVVVTGGPCAGKSTAMSWIQNAFTERGWRVLFVPETATELITGGVTPWTCRENLDFQKCQMKLQLAKEAVFREATAAMDAEKVLIVCDRGMLDNKAYMTEAEFSRLCAELHISEDALRDRYDAVFHLVTAAKGAEEAYTFANNAARYETVEQAVALDDRIIAAWTGHPHLRVIDNTTAFEEKLERLLHEILTFLGEPKPLGIEHRFLIEYPDVAWLESLPNCRRVEISETYLLSGPNEEVRIRQRGADGHFFYYETVNKPVDGSNRGELEHKLTQKEYLKRLADADPARRPIHKTRYCLVYRGQYFEIDLFPFWPDRVLLEVELSDENASVDLPQPLKVIREVTGDPAYRNAALAER